MYQWITGYIVAQGTKLHYYRSGGSKPPLVLVHGITDDGLCWTPVAEVLSADYDVIMVDLRGHGKSDAPENGYDLVTTATELAGLITGLELEAPVIMGHSLGAVTTITLSILNPLLPRAIILEDPPAFWDARSTPSEDVDHQAGMRLWMTGLKRKTREDLLADGRAENPGWSDAELEPWADSKHRFSLRITQFLDSPRTVPPDFQDLLKQIVSPVLLITGDPKRGAILGNDDVAKLQVSLPHLKGAQISEAGHNIRRDQFVRYLEVVQSFLSELSEVP